MVSGKKGDEKCLSGHCGDNVSNPHTMPSSVLNSPGIVVSRRKSLPVSANCCESGKTTFVSASAVVNKQVASKIAMAMRVFMGLTSPHKGGIIAASGEAPDLDAAVDTGGVVVVGSQMNLYRCDR